MTAKKEDVESLGFSSACLSRCLESYLSRHGVTWGISGAEAHKAVDMEDVTIFEYISVLQITAAGLNSDGNAQPCRHYYRSRVS